MLSHTNNKEYIKLAEAASFPTLNSFVHLYSLNGFLYLPIDISYNAQEDVKLSNR